MSAPDDPTQVFTIGMQGPSGLPMSWQGALPIAADQSPYSAKILQPVPVDVRSASVNIVLPALTDSSTCVVAIKDLYGSSASFPIGISPTAGHGTVVEVPGSLGTFASSTTIAVNGSIVWYVAMFSINAWVIWVR